MGTSVAEEQPAPQETEQGTQDDDLDTLLKQYESEADEAIKETKTEQPKENIDADRLKAIEQRLFQEDINSAVQSVKGQLKDVNLSDKMIRGYLEVEAYDDPRIASAFQNRSSNPGAWNKVLKGLANNMQKELGPTPDPKLNQDRKALETAVAGTKTATTGEMSEDDKRRKLASMSDAEFLKWKMNGAKFE